MNQGKWIDKWTVQSETDSGKFYTVSRAEDGTFGCSCPVWIFKKIKCKHILGISGVIEGMNPTNESMVNRMRFISKMHHIKLSCDNCKFVQGGPYIKRHPCNKSGYDMMENKKNLIFVQGEQKTFYILGRCCIHYEKSPNA